MSSRGAEDVGADDLHVVGALEGGRVGDGAGAHAGHQLLRPPRPGGTLRDPATGGRHGSDQLVEVSAEPRPQGAVTVTYLITFACYGCHLHGEESGSIDRGHNLPGSRLIEADPKRVSAERQSLDQRPYSMDRSRREAVLASFAGAMLRTPLEPVSCERTHQPRSLRTVLDDDARWIEEHSCPLR